MVGPMLDDSGSGTVNLVTWTEAQAARQGGGAGGYSSDLYATPSSGAVAEPSKPRGGKRGKKDASSTAPVASTAAQQVPFHARPEMVVGASGEGSAVRMRMAAAQALGQLVKSVHSHVSLDWTVEQSDRFHDMSSSPVSPVDICGTHPSRYVIHALPSLESDVTPIPSLLAPTAPIGL